MIFYKKSFDQKMSMKNFGGRVFSRRGFCNHTKFSAKITKEIMDSFDKTYDVLIVFQERTIFPSIFHSFFQKFGSLLLIAK